MTAITICQKYDWAKFVPSQRILFYEAEDIKAYQRKQDKLYSDERIGVVSITNGGNWEVYHHYRQKLSSLIILNSELMMKYSLYQQYYARIQKKWDLLKKILYRRIALPIYFKSWVIRACPQKKRMNTRQKRFMKRYLLKRAFTAWSKSIQSPFKSGDWTNFPKTGWRFINDLAKPVSIICSSFSFVDEEHNKRRSTCFKCNKPCGNQIGVNFFRCGHAIHEACLEIPGQTIHECELGVGIKVALPSPALIQPFTGVYVLDRVFNIIGPEGKLWEVRPSWKQRGRDLLMSDLVLSPVSKRHVWFLISGVTKWRRRSMMVAERQRFATSYLHIHLTQVVWNEFATEIQKVYHRLTRIGALTEWRKNIGILSLLLRDFCHIFESKNTPEDSDKHTFISAEVETFERMYKQIMLIYQHIFKDGINATWFQTLRRYSSDKILGPLIQSQVYFEAHIKELFYYIDQLVQKSDARLNLDRGLDPKHYQMSIWCICFYRMGFTFFSDKEQESVMNFVMKFRNQLTPEIGRIRFAFKWNSQTIVYKPIQKPPKIKDNLIFQIGEVGSLNIKGSGPTPIHFITMGLDKSIELMEHNTKLPYWRWIKAVCS